MRAKVELALGIVLVSGVSVYIGVILYFIVFETGTTICPLWTPCESYGP